MFGLSLDFKTMNKGFHSVSSRFFVFLGWGGSFSLWYFSLLMLWLCITFQLHMNPGTGKKVCGGGGGWWWWCLNANLVFSFGPNLRFGIGPSWTKSCPQKTGNMSCLDFVLASRKLEHCWNNWNLKYAPVWIKVIHPVRPIGRSATKCPPFLGLFSFLSFLCPRRGCPRVFSHKKGLS